MIVLLIDANVGQPVDSMLCRGCPVSARIDNDPPVTVIGDNIGMVQPHGDSVGIVSHECRIVSDFAPFLAIQDVDSRLKGTNVRAELTGHVEYLCERYDLTYLWDQHRASVVILGHIPVNGDGHEEEHHNLEDYAWSFTLAIQSRNQLGE